MVSGVGGTRDNCWSYVWARMLTCPHGHQQLCHEMTLVSDGLTTKSPLLFHATTTAAADVVVVVALPR